MTTLTLPLHRAGEPAIDLPDLFEQFYLEHRFSSTPDSRWDISVRRLPTTIDMDPRPVKIVDMGTYRILHYAT